MNTLREGHRFTTDSDITRNQMKVKENNIITTPAFCKTKHRPQNPGGQSFYNDLDPGYQGFYIDLITCLKH